MLVRHGHALMAERGFARFSAREAARRAGYAVGTIYNVFGSLDAFLVAINSQTFLEWAAALEYSLADVEPAGTARLEVLVHAYFDYARSNANAWMAIYDHRHEAETVIAAEDHDAREALTGIVDREVVTWLGRPDSPAIRRLVRSLIAMVHGHCALWITGSFSLMNEPDPAGQAVARVLEVLAAQRLR